MSIGTFIRNLPLLFSQDLRQGGAGSLENPGVALTAAVLGRASLGDLSVSDESAMRITAVLGCVRVLSESVAALPLVVHERMPDGTKRLAVEHPIYSLLHDRPNAYMSSFRFREVAMIYVLLHGNTYWEINFGGDGYPKTLWPLPVGTRPFFDSQGRLFYRVGAGSNAPTLRPEQVFHVPGLGRGVEGKSVIRYAEESLSSALAAQQYASAFFQNGAFAGGVLSTDGKLDEAQRERVKASWNSTHQGPAQAHGVAVLEGGLKWTATVVPPEDAQAIETRKYSVEDVCRIFRVPPHKVAMLDRATFSNIEQQSIDFVTESLVPWLTRFEQEYNFKLFGPSERGRFYVKHKVDGLLRGDISSRYQAYSVGRQWGWLSADDVRDLEDQNPIPDGQGKSYLVPMNMIPADQHTPAPQDQRPTANSAHGRVDLRTDRQIKDHVLYRKRLTSSYRQIMRDVLEQIARRERNDILEGAKKTLAERDAQQFEAWMTGFFEQHTDFVKKKIAPVFAGISEAARLSVSNELGKEIADGPESQRFLSDFVDGCAGRHTGSTKKELLVIVAKAQADGTDAYEALSTRFNDWIDNRPKRETHYESVRAENAFAKQAYREGGVLKLRWVTVGKSCPYCDRMNGEITSIDGSFLASGENYQPEGAERPLTPTHNVGHAPLHEGCDCGITYAI